MMRGRPLAVRLAALLAGVVIGVLDPGRRVVNRAASRSLDETLEPRDQQRLELALTVVDEALERGVEGGPLLVPPRTIAGESGGTVRVLEDAGDSGRRRRGCRRARPSETLSRDLSASAGGGSVRAQGPERAGAGSSAVQRGAAADRRRGRGRPADRGRLRRVPTDSPAPRGDDGRATTRRGRPHVRARGAPTPSRPSWRPPSTPWRAGSSGPRSSAAAPRATWHTTSPPRPPSSNRSYRRWSTASFRPTPPSSRRHGRRPPASRA